MNVFDLMAKITLDTSDYDQGLDDASDKSSSFASKLKTGLSTAAKVGAAAVTAASTAVGVLTKTSIDQYADYEQLVGGAQLLFGDAYSYISDKADAAYQNVQMSANDYLRQVNGFATGLKTALGGNEQAAAELADKIVTAEADIVAATGNTQENVQNAFNGIMKSNYTMLDNLQLGITPTKEGFQDVIDKVNEWNEANGRTTNYVIDNLADCQSALIDYIDMQGLSGYAMEEASGTIQGSLASVKGAWSNLMTAISADGWDIGVYVSNFVESVKTAAGNIIPVISQVLSGIGEVIQGLAPVISEQLPVLIETVLPSLLSAGIGILSGIVSGIVQALPSIVDAGINLLDKLTSGIESGIPDMMSRLPEVITNIINFLTANLPKIVSKGFDLLISFATGIINGIPSLVGKLPQVITAFINYVTTMLPTIIGKGVELVVKLAVGIIQGIPQLVAKLPQIIAAIVNGIGRLMGSITDIGKNIVQGIWNGISGMVSWFTSKVKNFFSGIVSSVKGLLGIHSPSKVFAGIGGFMAEGLGEGWDDAYSKIERDINKDLDFSGNITTNGNYSGYGKTYGAALSGAIFNINVNGANIQDDQSLAERIAFEIQQIAYGKEAVFGAA